MKKHNEALYTPIDLAVVAQETAKFFLSFKEERVTKSIFDNIISPHFDEEYLEKIAKAEHEEIDISEFREKIVSLHQSIIRREKNNGVLSFENSPFFSAIDTIKKAQTDQACYEAFVQYDMLGNVSHSCTGFILANFIQDSKAEGIKNAAILNNDHVNILSPILRAYMSKAITPEKCKEKMQHAKQLERKDGQRPYPEPEYYAKKIAFDANKVFNNSDIDLTISPARRVNEAGALSALYKKLGYFPFKDKDLRVWRMQAPSGPLAQETDPKTHHAMGQAFLSHVQTHAQSLAAFIGLTAMVKIDKAQSLGVDIYPKFIQEKGIKDVDLERYLAKNTQFNTEEYYALKKAAYAATLPDDVNTENISYHEYVTHTIPAHDGKPPRVAQSELFDIWEKMLTCMSPKLAKAFNTYFKAKDFPTANLAYNGNQIASAAALKNSVGSLGSYMFAKLGSHEDNKVAASNFSAASHELGHAAQTTYSDKLYRGAYLKDFAIEAYEAFAIVAEYQVNNIVMQHYHNDNTLSVPQRAQNILSIMALQIDGMSTFAYHNAAYTRFEKALYDTMQRRMKDMTDEQQESFEEIATTINGITIEGGKKEENLKERAEVLEKWLKKDTQKWLPTAKEISQLWCEAYGREYDKTQPDMGWTVPGIFFNPGQQPFYYADYALAFNSAFNILNNPEHLEYMAENLGYESFADISAHIGQDITSETYGDAAILQYNTLISDYEKLKSAIDTYESEIKEHSEKEVSLENSGIKFSSLFQLQRTMDNIMKEKFPEISRTPYYTI